VQSELATAADVEPISDLVNAAYRGAGGSVGWTHEAELMSGDRVSVQDVAAMIDDGMTTVLIRRRDDAAGLLGCVAVRLDAPGHCTISMLAVAPELQAARLGRALLEDAEQFAAERGATVAKLTVVQVRESLIAWYERRGYRQTGSHEAFPYDETVGTPRRRDLHFVVLEKALDPHRPPNDRPAGED
jgi:ribosomal protein S18 acetylase RimI-like enzyme